MLTVTISSYKYSTFCSRYYSSSSSTLSHSTFSVFVVIFGTKLFLTYSANISFVSFKHLPNLKVDMWT